MEKVEMELQGMSCGHCVRTVADALNRVEGARVESVEIGTARVALDPTKGSPVALRAAVEEEGYVVTRIETVR